MNQPTNQPSSSTKVSFADRHTRRERGRSGRRAGERRKDDAQPPLPFPSPLSLVIMLRGPGRVYITTIDIIIIIDSPAGAKARTQQRDTCDFIF